MAARSPNRACKATARLGGIPKCYAAKELGGSAEGAVCEYSAMAFGACLPGLCLCEMAACKTGGPFIAAFFSPPQHCRCMK